MQYASKALRMAPAVLGVAGLLGLAAAAFVVWGGRFDVSATTPHFGIVERLLGVAMQRSVAVRAAVVTPPPLDDARLVARGAACFRDHCVQCHGAPGVSRGDAAKGMQPVPDSLIGAARHWRTRELYWLTRYGIKMSGMPAWEFRLGESDLWAVVAFLERLPTLSTADYAADVAAVAGDRCTAPPSACGTGGCTSSAQLTGVWLVPRAEPAHASLLLRQYSCTACHSIPGVPGPDTRVGPALEGFGRRELVAGRLANTPDNVAAWIRSPQRIDPGTAMPDLGVSEEHARRMAEYLGGLR